MKLGRILFVSRQFPRDVAQAEHGIFQRMSVLLSAAQQACGQLDVLFFAPAARLAGGTADADAQALLQRWGINAGVTLAALGDGPARSWAATYLQPLRSVAQHPDYMPTAGAAQARAVLNAAQHGDRGPDLVVAHKLHGALAVGAAIELGLQAPYIVDIDDVEHVKYLRELARPPHYAGKALLALHALPLRSAERRVVRDAAASLVCSDVDHDRLAPVAGAGRVVVVPNSIALDAAQYRRQPARSHDLLFVGTYSHRPNVEAAEFLLQTLLPRVRSAVPDARLLLVGPHIEQLPSHGRPLPGVEWIGFAPDLDPLYLRARLVCCPIFAGGGTRIKIIEAAARGVPVVATPLGAEGLGLRDGHDVLLGSDADQLGAHCLALLRDDALAQALAEHAWASAQRFDRGHVVAQLAELMRGKGRPAGRAERVS